MGILIKGMEMPEDGSWKTVRIYPDGTCAVPNWQGDCTLIKGAQAISVPPHGRLIDADALKNSLSFAENTAKWAVPTLRAVLMVIDEMPTIIQAEEGE